MSPLANVQSVLARPFMSALFFVTGVAYDTLTLMRIDRLQDNLILLFSLSPRSAFSSFSPVVLAWRQWSRLPSNPRLLFCQSPGQIPLYYPMAMQFLLGGLFSAYAVFYSRSATLTGTGIFLGVLVLLLMANEFLRDRLSNVRLLVALHALARSKYGWITVNAYEKFVREDIYRLRRK